MNHTVVLLLASAALFLAVEASSPKSTSKEEQLLFGFITPTCFDAFFARYEWSNVECIKSVISKALSYAIIAGSLVLKLPQIVKIIKAKDCTGLRPTSFYLEVVLYLSSTIYNVLKGYPISTWGEMAIVLIQNIILVVLIWMYYYIPNTKETIGWKHQLVLVIVFLLLAGGMMMIPSVHQWLLASAGIPVSIVARIPQVIANFQQGHTGQLAFITLLLNFVGSIARFFTTLQETGDIVQLAGYGVGSALNGMLVLQVLMYWKATNKALAQTIKKKTQ